VPAAQRLGRIDNLTGAFAQLTGDYTLVICCLCRHFYLGAWQIKQINMKAADVRDPTFERP